MFKVFAIATGAALLALAPGAASAQKADDGMLCVYDAASTEDYESVAEAFLYGDDKAASTADALLNKATQTCSDKFKFSEGEADAARDLAIYGASVDYLTEDLMFMDVSDEAIDGLFDVYRALDDDDIDMFYDAGWRDDANFIARLKARLLASGFPDQADELGTAYDIFEISAMVDDAMLTFTLAGDE
ncbi:MAG: hypothetical protein ABMA14_01910 [Hyphomonadaceae bacterium]